MFVMSATNGASKGADRDGGRTKRGVSLTLFRGRWYKSPRPAALERVPFPRLHSINGIRFS
jgi:hypothetical protein